MAELWMQFCLLYVKHRGTFSLDINLVPTLRSNIRNLERKGFLISADGDRIRYNVRGHQYEFVEELNNLEAISFCINRKEHSK